MTAEPTHAAFRRRVREAVLDAAHEQAVTHGWEQLRVGAVAVAAGVSRPTLYREFGTKDAIGEALISREADRFIAGVREVLAGHDDAARGIREGSAFTLRQAETNPLLRAVLTGERPGAVALLPYLTSRSQAIVERGRDMLAAWVAGCEPGRDPGIVEEVVDAVVRLVISHLVAPEVDAEVVADRMGRLVRAGLRDGGR